MSDSKPFADYAGAMAARVKDAEAREREKTITAEEAHRLVDEANEQYFRDIGLPLGQ